MKYLLYLISILIIVLSGCQNPHDTSALLKLEEGFKNPPTNAKPKAYWCLVNGNFDLTQMKTELKEFKEKGVGTLDIWDVSGWVDENKVIPDGPPFMGDESLQAIAYAIREAGKMGMDIGLTISSSWNAGGDWVKPEDGVMGLFSNSAIVSGGEIINVEIPFPSIPTHYDKRRKNILYKDKNGLPTFYKDVAILAYQIEKDSTINEILDISNYYKNGKLKWEVPKGKWEITRYVCTGTGQPLMAPSPNSNGLMIDHFSAEATIKHINFFFEKLESELGDLSKTALKYLYTDSYEANSAVWTTKMPEEFFKRTGYEITQYLPALKGFTVQNKDITNRFLFDYKKVLSDLIIENHYELGQKLCREKGLDFIAEAGGPGPPVHNVPFESLSSLGKLGTPRGEFWLDSLRSEEGINLLQIVKGPASAAHLYNRPRVEAESFTGTQIWQYGLSDLKSAADRAMCEGLTSFVYHTSPHIPREAGKPGWVYNFGTIINNTRAWWDLSSGFHNYLGRSCFLLQQGEFIGDVLYYYGDKAPNFVDPKHIDPSLGFGYDYDVTNSDIILNHLDVNEGYYTLPHGQRYKILVLPNDDAMNPEVLSRISELVKKGGILVGNKPSKSHSQTQQEINDKKVLELANSIWLGDSKNEYGEGIVYNKDKSLREILHELDVSPDVQINFLNPEKFIDFIHRNTKNEDIYYFRNTTNEEQVFELTLRSDLGVPELWNPDNAQISFQPIFIRENGFTKIPLKLSALGSVFVLIRKSESKNQIIKVIKDGVQLFPNTKKYFPITYLNDELIFQDNGSYELTYSDGKVEETKVNNILSEDITGSWEIRFPFGWGTPTRTTFHTLHSWTNSEDDGIKHFSGIATYHKTFISKNRNKKDRIYLNLGEVSKVAKIYLNGKDLGIKWYSPFIYDITDAIKEGKNYLVVEVANVMNNQMVGDSYRNGRNKRTNSNITRGPNAWASEYKNLRLIESGLLGPVRIIKYNSYKY